MGKRSKIKTMTIIKTNIFIVNYFKEDIMGKR
jgi:hypothetical protein